MTQTICTCGHEPSRHDYNVEADDVTCFDCLCSSYASKARLAKAWDQGFQAAERKENIERGYELAFKALGSRAPRPSDDELDPPNPYEG